MTLYARQAIETRFHGPTNVRGSRYSARADAGKVTVHADDSKNALDNHRAAAEALCRKLDWHGTLAVGAHPVTYGYVWVFVESDTSITV